MTGEFVGSPLYMSPEQITAGRAPLDHRTDIYSLGATLYQLLTLEPPYPGRRRDEVIGQIMHKEAVRPRRKNKRVPVDLETICLKAIEKDPDRRYQTAGQLAEDLRRFVNRHAIQARRIGVVGQAIKFARRHPAVVTLLLISFLLGILAISFANVANQRALQQATERRIRELEQIDELKERFLLAAASGDLPEAKELLQKAPDAGVPTGWIQLMNGVVAVLEGRYDDAIIELEQANNRLQESTAAYAMLSLAYLHDGDEDQYFRRLRRLVELPANDFFDHLVKGWAEARWVPYSAKRDFEQALQIKRSQVAILLYAQSRRINAMELADSQESLDEALAAIDDLAAVRRLAPDNVLAIAESVIAHLIAASRNYELGNLARQDEHIQDARNDLSLLPEGAASADAEVAKITYWHRAGDDASILTRFEQEVQRGARLNDYHPVHCASIYFKSRQFDKAKTALNELDRKQTRFDSLPPAARAFVQLGADASVASKTQIANDYFRELQIRMRRSSGATLHFDWATLRLLGKSKESLAHLANRFRASNESLPEMEVYIPIADFMVGAIPADTLIDKCGARRGALAEALFVAACDSLASGRRVEAESRFQSLVDLHYYLSFATWWSQAFLERLKEDDTWPHSVKQFDDGV